MAADHKPSTVRNKSRSSAGNEPDPAEVPREEQQWFRWAALALITVALVVLSITLALPYLAGLTWGAALAIIAWPMHRVMARLIPWPRVSAAASTLIVTSIIIGAVLFVTYRFAKQAGAAAATGPQTEVAIEGLDDRMAQWPMIGPVADWLKQVDVNIEDQIRKVAQYAVGNLRAMAQGSIAVIVQFLVMIFTLYYLFLDRDLLLQGVRDVLPLSKAESNRVFKQAGDSVHANVYATLVTSIIDSVTGGFVFWAVGLPGALIWTAVMFILALVPIIGAGMVWVPAAIYLAASGRWLAAGIVLAWGTTVFIFVDNFLYVRLVGNRLRMHAIPALVAFLGGLVVFGIAGMILGPAIVAVTMAFLDVWRQRMREAVPD